MALGSPHIQILTLSVNGVPHQLKGTEQWDGLKNKTQLYVAFRRSNSATKAEPYEAEPKKNPGIYL